jgi:superfamily II DNA/RNA helicase
MVRRLKEDIRQLVGGFPERKIDQIDLGPDVVRKDAPELVLSGLLEDYRKVRAARMVGATKRKQAEAGLLVIHLQQRLLSSIEAFARTLAVHQRTMERLWKQERESRADLALKERQDLDLLSDAVDRDDERSQLPEEELQALEDLQVETATELGFGSDAQADREREQALLMRMHEIAEAGRGLPDARVRCLIEWIRKNMCEGARVPGDGKPVENAQWQDLRILIFTEYDDTKRYLVNMLRCAIEGTHLSEHRILVFHGPTPPDKREAIKRAFNLPPNEHPVRILVATDAAREGLNLQAHCHHVFHIDVPWNPSRLEQRNGRVDRKMQPAAKVFCHYFVYLDRPEDRVLRALVRKTDTIRRELGSLADVLEARLAATLRHGIHHDEVEKLEKEITDEDIDSENRAATEEELEATRERHEELEKQIDGLRNRINDAKKWIGLETDELRDALSCSLEILGSEPLKPITTANGGPPRYVFPNLDARRGADPTWAATLETLRVPPEDGKRDFVWRKESPIRPVVFSAPDEINDDIVQLHLSHRVVQRLLGRFLAQGFVHHDLSRACLAQSEDAIPRVILLGRISLYGPGAIRLHDEMLTVTAKWSQPSSRAGALAPYAREAETRTLELLERAMRSKSSGKIPERVVEKLMAALEQDIAELLPRLQERGETARVEAEDRLKHRGRAEADSIKKILEDQKRRVATELGKSPDLQTYLHLDLGQSPNESERRQYEANRRYWQRWLNNVDNDINTEPDRILEFYKVATFRIEPVGLAYLWPVTG